MTLLEASKAALEAFEKMPFQNSEMVSNAAHNLRTAISEAEKCEPVAWAFFFSDGDISNDFFESQKDGLRWMASDDCIWDGYIAPVFAHPAPAVPAGYKLVPLVPTEEMIEQGTKWVEPVVVWEAMIEASPTQSIPSGWKLVPENITAAMFRAATECFNTNKPWADQFKAAYKAMLAAAPEAP